MFSVRQIGMFISFYMVSFFLIIFISFILTMQGFKENREIRLKKQSEYERMVMENSKEGEEYTFYRY